MGNNTCTHRKVDKQRRKNRSHQSEENYRSSKGPETLGSHMRSVLCAHGETKERLRTPPHGPPTNFDGGRKKKKRKESTTWGGAGVAAPRGRKLSKLGPFANEEHVRKDKTGPTSRGVALDEKH